MVSGEWRRGTRLGSPYKRVGHKSSPVGGKVAGLETKVLTCWIYPVLLRIMNWTEKSEFARPFRSGSESHPQLGIKT